MHACTSYAVRCATNVPKLLFVRCNQGASGEVDGISEVSARSGGYPPSFSLTFTFPASSSCKQTTMPPLASPHLRRRKRLCGGKVVALRSFVQLATLRELAQPCAVGPPQVLARFAMPRASCMVGKCMGRGPAWMASAAQKTGCRMPSENRRFKLNQNKIKQMLFYHFIRAT